MSKFVSSSVMLRALYMHLLITKGLKFYSKYQKVKILILA